MEQNINNIEKQDQINNAKYNDLIKEFVESRQSLKKMITDLEECKQSVLKSVADSNDYRNKYAREERLKTLSSFFDTELKVRQEYNRSIMSEIEMRRKLDQDDNGNDTEVDIRAIAKQLSKLSKEKND